MTRTATQKQRSAARLIELAQRDYAKYQLAADAIAEQLDESELAAKYDIATWIRRAGMAYCVDKVADAQTIQANGGLYSKAAKRNHTLGGIWFKLMRQWFKANRHAR